MCERPKPSKALVIASSIRGIVESRGLRIMCKCPVSILIDVTSYLLTEFMQRYSDYENVRHMANFLIVSLNLISCARLTRKPRCSHALIMVLSQVPDGNARPIGAASYYYGLESYTLRRIHFTFGPTPVNTSVLLLTKPMTYIVYWWRKRAERKLVLKWDTPYLLHN